MAQRTKELAAESAERKRSEEALRAASAYNRNLIEASLDPLVTIGPDGKITDVNATTEAVTGLSRGELIETDFSGYFTEPERARAGYQQVFREGFVRDYELKIRHRDGHVTSVLYNASVYKDELGRNAGVFAAARDITERVGVEEILRSSEEKYRLVVENANDGILIVQDGVVVFANRRAAEMAGVQEGMFPRRPMLDFIYPEDREMVVQYHIQRMRGEKVPTCYEVRVVSSTGETIWVENNVIMTSWEGKTAALSFLRDISAQKKLESQLFTARKMEAVGTLAGGIAHDFNNALTGIFGFGELLRNRVSGDEQGLHDLDEIMHCAERAATLTRQLLTYARRQVIEPVNLCLNTLAADLMKLIAQLVGEHIEITTRLAEDLPTIHADRGQIEQVLMNLCLNARDAMPQGGKLLIETENVYLDEEYVRHNPYMRTGRFALLRVSDTGIGMDEKTRERVFEPFFTTKEPDKGTGLGLAMVYGIVKQHDGFIHFYSEPGIGTTFKVYFPAVEALPDAVPGKRREETVRGGTETILFAEDEEAIRALGERTLKDLGYNVLVARNGEEAIEIFRRSKEVVLAVLDVVMPRKGGKEAFDEMQKENPRLKVIFMSGYSANAIHESFVLTAGVPFLQKPFGPTMLARKIREVLDTSG